MSKENTRFKRLTGSEKAEQVIAYVGKAGSLRAASRMTGIAYSSLRDHYSGDRTGKRGQPRISETLGKVQAGNDSEGHDRKSYEEPRVKGKKIGKAPAGSKRYLLTCAQNNTAVHRDLFENLLAFAKHVDAELHVSRFTYKKAGYTAQYSKGDLDEEDTNKIWWDPRIAPYLSDKRIELARGLHWCADLDILPTAKRPLSGLESYSGRASGIFPHTKIAMEPVASGKHEGAKHNYTTGTVTLRNYIQRKAGMQADFHHCYGALLVEVDAEGTWFVRQVNADDDGSFYELDRFVSHGHVEEGHRLAGIYWGDGHDAESNEDYVNLAFGPGGIKDVLRPEKDFIGDVLSFKSRSHHDLKDPMVMFQRKQQGLGCVKSECLSAGGFFDRMWREWCDTHSVYGNHERHLGIWLKTVDARFDPTNSIFWSEMQAATFKFIKSHPDHFEPNYLALAFVQAGRADLLAKMTFLQEDQITIICPDHGGGIRCDIHGDRGANGSRGTPMGFTKMGRKICIGDKHSAGIWDGVYIAGTFEEIRNNDWTRGDGSWSYSHIIIYPNGKRAIVTCYDKKWKA